MKTNFIPVWKFCKKNNIEKQKLYRWIREGKIDKSNIERRKVVVERIFIKEDC